MFGFGKASPDRSAVRHDQPGEGSYLPDAPAGGRPRTDEPISGSCDGCAAAAVVRARLPGGSELMFCGHHGRRHAPALRAQGAEVTGELAFAMPIEQRAPLCDR